MNVNSLNISELLHISTQDENINICLIVALLLSCLNFVLSLVNNLAYAEQRASLVSFFNLLGQALFVGTLYIYYRTGISLIFFEAIGEGACQSIKNLAETIYVLKKYPELKAKLTDAE